jgi:hypothetical protein
MANFFHEYLTKYINDGQFNKEDLLNFYFSDEVRMQYKSIEKDIGSLT